VVSRIDMTKPTITILGGNEMACPAIERIRQHGYTIIVIDGNSQSPGASVADVFLNVDFSKVPEVFEALSPYHLDGIVPLNDFGIAAAANVARARALPGWNEFAQLCFTSKIAMKKAWAAKALRTARWVSSSVGDLAEERFPEWNIWPAVAKPSFSGGGSRGVVVGYNWTDLKTKVQEQRSQYRDGEVVIEEFIDGTEHTLEVIVCQGKPFLLSISDKENYPGSSTVVQNLYFPGSIGNSHRAALEEIVFAACNAMNLTDGTAHFEVIIKDELPFLLEVGGRPGGGLNFHPICELSTGFDYPGLLAAVLCGRELDFSRKAPCHLAWHYFPIGNGVLRAIEGFDELKSEPDLVHSAIYEKIGKPRLDIRDDLARPGYFLVKANSHQEARARAASLVSKVKFSTGG
jgi:biotin carboxylase